MAVGLAEGGWTDRSPCSVCSIERQSHDRAIGAGASGDSAEGGIAEVVDAPVGRGEGVPVSEEGSGDSADRCSGLAGCGAVERGGAECEHSAITSSQYVTVA